MRKSMLVTPELLEGLKKERDKLKLPSLEALLRHLMGMDQLERGKGGWPKGRPGRKVWPFEAMEVGDMVSYDLRPERAGALYQAVTRALKASGWTKAIRTDVINGKVIVTRVR